MKEETRSNKGIICPYCHEGRDPDFGIETDYIDGQVAEECEGCDKFFYKNTNIITDYSGIPDCELNHEEHNYSTDPEVTDNVHAGEKNRGEEYHVCLKCNHTIFK